MLKTRMKADKTGRKAEVRHLDKAGVERRNQEFEAWNNCLWTRSASATALQVIFRPAMGRYSLHKHEGGDFVFVFADPDSVSPTEREQVAEAAEPWKESAPIDAHEVLADFAKVGNPTEALEFLSRTGAFLPDAADFTWGEFQRWQRFAFLVRERKELVAAAQNHDRVGEAAEVLKAISGYPSTFFDNQASVPVPIEEMRKYSAATIEKIIASHRESEERRRDQHKASCRWFKDPPGERVFLSRIYDEELERDPMYHEGLAEFLRPRDKLQSVFRIAPKVTIRAIAAAIYADWLTGIEYNKCPVCSKLFEIRNRSWQKYCSEKCKGTAHMQRYRRSRQVASPGPEQKHTRTERKNNTRNKARGAPIQGPRHKGR